MSIEQDVTNGKVTEERSVVTFRRRGAPQTTVRLAVTIDEAAAMVGVSYNTLWRAVRDNQFPGLKIRDRIVIPLKAVEMLIDAAVTTGELIDVAAWAAHWIATPADAVA